MICLERLKLAKQLIELRVRDFRVSENVVPLFVMANAVAEFFELTLDRIHVRQDRRQAGPVAKPALSISG